MKRCAALLIVVLATGCSSPALHLHGGGTSTSIAAIPLGTVACSTVPAQLVNRYLGTQIAGPSARYAKGLSTCSYQSGGFRAAAVVIIRTSATVAVFSSDATALGAYGATTTTVVGLGDRALAVSVGTGPDQTNTVAVLAGSTEVTVSAPVALAKVESLVQAIIGPGT